MCIFLQATSSTTSVLWLYLNRSLILSQVLWVNVQRIWFLIHFRDGFTQGHIPWAIYPIILRSCKTKPNVCMSCKIDLVGKWSNLLKNMWTSPDTPKGKLDPYLEQLLQNSFSHHIHLHVKCSWLIVTQRTLVSAAKSSFNSIGFQLLGWELNMF